MIYIHKGTKFQASSSLRFTQPFQSPTYSLANPHIRLATKSKEVAVRFFLLDVTRTQFRRKNCVASYNPVQCFGARDLNINSNRG